MINNGDGQHPALDTIPRITPNRYAVPEAESHREVVVMRVSGLVDVHLDSPTSQKEWQFRRR